MKPVSSKKKLRIKIVIAIVCLLFLIGSIVFQQVRRDKWRDEYKESQEKIEQEKSEQIVEQEPKEDVPNFGTQEESENDVPNFGTEEPEENGEANSQPPEEKVLVAIANRDEYAAALLGEKVSLLNESLTELTERMQLQVTTATIIYVAIPQSNPESTNFYLKLDDELATLVILTYHSGEGIVTASNCPYTEEEIYAEVWEYNGPSNRDITPEEEAALKEQEGVNDIP